MSSKTYPFPKALIQIFCKAPIPGEVKSRLMPELSAAEACEVHQALALQTFNLVAGLALCPVDLYCASQLTHPFFQQASAQFGFSLRLQSGNNLGARMYSALQAGLAQSQAVMLIGCDCPSLDAEVLMTALSALENGNDVVIAPTEDGGYCLIGMTEPQESLFTDIAWSSATVMPQTRQRITERGLRALELPMQWDVDDYKDYLRYQQWLKASKTA